MFVPRRALTVVVVMTMALVPALWASAAFASTQDDLDAANARLAAAQNSANEAAAAFTQAESKLAETQAKIAALDASIQDTKAKAAQLQAIVRDRAVYAYTHTGEDLDAMVDASSPVQAARRSQLLDQANNHDNDVVHKLAALNEDLRTQQKALDAQESQEQAIKSSLQSKADELNAKLNEAQAARNALVAKLDAEIAAMKAAADAARQQQLEAQRAALAPSQTISTGGSGQIVSGPVIGGFQCPVSGASYTNDFGGARGHPGIDMFVPTGRSAVAVMSGTVSFVPNEGAGGNAAYLSANDGNVYYYAHFSQFVGGSRSVSQGEIIGLTGMTGNASAPHLHFEIRLGGANGTRTNPYPTLKNAGC